MFKRKNTVCRSSAYLAIRFLMVAHVCRGRLGSKIPLFWRKHVGNLPEGFRIYSRKRLSKCPHSDETNLKTILMCIVWIHNGIIPIVCASGPSLLMSNPDLSNFIFACAFPSTNVIRSWDIFISIITEF